MLASWEDIIVMSSSLGKGSKQQVGVVGGSDQMNQPLETQLTDEELSSYLAASDFSEESRSGCQLLLPCSFVSSRSSLLSTSHCDDEYT